MPIINISLNFICNTSQTAPGEQGICIAGCVASEDRCSEGRTCIQGQCQVTTNGNGDGDDTRLRDILIIGIVIVVVIVIFGGMIYAVYV